MSSDEKPKSPRLPPRWFIRTAWYVHRGLYRVSRGRIGLWRPNDEADKWGTLRLTTTGRRTGRQRSVMVGYFEDGPNYVTLAMNGWGAAEPAWWLNLLDNPDASLELVDGTKLVRARAATGDERERLWARWRVVTENLDSFAARRPSETAVVVLEPRPAEAEDTSLPAE